MQLPKNYALVSCSTRLQHFMFYAATVGRELAPAIENGTFSNFPKENKTIIACGDVILLRKITGGSKLPPYAGNQSFSLLQPTTVWN